MGGWGGAGCLQIGPGRLHNGLKPTRPMPSVTVAGQRGPNCFFSVDAFFGTSPEDGDQGFPYMLFFYAAFYGPLEPPRGSHGQLFGFARVCPEQKPLWAAGQFHSECMLEYTQVMYWWTRSWTHLGQLSGMYPVELAHRRLGSTRYRVTPGTSVDY